jgi:hypothetical protein
LAQSGMTPKLGKPETRNSLRDSIMQKDDVGEKVSRLLLIKKWLKVPLCFWEILGLAPDAGLWPIILTRPSLAGQPDGVPSSKHRGLL